MIDFSKQSLAYAAGYGFRWYLAFRASRRLLLHRFLVIFMGFIPVERLGPHPALPVSPFAQL